MANETKTPLDFACSHTEPDGMNCGAEAGEQCKWVRPGCNSALWSEQGKYHAERIEAAAAMNAPSADTPTVAEFEQAAGDKLYGG